MSESPIRIIQITDCHLGEHEGMELLSMNPDESLKDVLSLISDNHDTHDLLIATGDLANDPSANAYERLYQALSKEFSDPFSWLPGNHDSPELMVKHGSGINQKQHIFGNWLIMLLNSRKQGCIYGYLADEELQFLERCLMENPNKHVMICLHHQPVPIGSEWMDNYIVRNADDFWRIVEPYPNVKLVLWGHVHQEFVDKHHNISLLATPSTCIQFTPLQKDFAVENTMPGYRWLELNDDGSFTTGVERVSLKNYGTNLNSHGY